MFSKKLVPHIFCHCKTLQVDLNSIVMTDTKRSALVVEADILCLSGSHISVITSLVDVMLAEGSTRVVDNCNCVSGRAAVCASNTAALCWALWRRRRRAAGGRWCGAWGGDAGEGVGGGESRIAKARTIAAIVLALAILYYARCDAHTTNEIINFVATKTTATETYFPVFVAYLVT